MGLFKKELELSTFCYALFSKIISNESQMNYTLYKKNNEPYGHILNESLFNKYMEMQNGFWVCAVLGATMFQTLMGYIVRQDSQIIGKKVFNAYLQAMEDCGFAKEKIHKST